MGEFIIENGVLTKYKGKDRDVVIPDSVIAIGWSAFDYCRSMKSITIPDSVTSIGERAFSRCWGLADENGLVIVRDVIHDCKKNVTSVTIPDSVTSIGKDAFNGCESLTSITIPDSVTSIGDGAFCDCKSLTSITIPDSVAYIGDSAFSFCSSLEKIITKVKLTNNHIRYTSFEKPISTNDPAMLPNYMKPLAAIGYAENPDDEDTDRKKAHLNYLNANANKLISETISHPALLYLMLENKFLKPEDVDSFIEAVAGNTEMTAALLDYKENKLTAEEKENAKQKAEAREKKVNDFVRSVDAIDELQGKTFVVSGDLTTFSDRDEFRACLEACGATLTENPDKQTAYLITNTPDSGTRKNKKAEYLGIRKITEAQFNAMIGRDEDEIKEMNSH